jgi:DNA-3-methyladenine glycosylase
MRRLTRRFFEGDTLSVAKKLVGKQLVTCLKGGRTAAIITETEAYCGVDDPACHVYQGRITGRNRILFSAPGSVYVYLIYGMYCCFNIVAHAKGRAGGVFIRAAEPVLGTDIMLKRHAARGHAKKDEGKLADGPGKLCRSLGIDKKLYGEDVFGSRIYLLEGEKTNAGHIAALPRINIDYAGKGKYYPWRFVLK